MGKKIPRIPRARRWCRRKEGRKEGRVALAEFRARLALGRLAAARKPLRTVESTPPHFLASFLPLFPRPPPAGRLSLPRCFFHRRVASFPRSPENLLPRIGRAFFARPRRGVADKRVGEGTIKRDGNCTGCPSFIHWLVRSSERK